MGLASIKSLKASALGLEPHLLGLRNQGYIFFSLSSSWTSGKCPWSHSTTHFSHLSADFSLTSQSLAHKDNSNIQWFWPHDPQNSSPFINSFTQNYSHFFKNTSTGSLKCLWCLFLPGHDAWISTTKWEMHDLFCGIYIYPLSFLFALCPLGFF